VKHPCIPALVASGEDEKGRVYYTVEYCDGADLNKAIAESPGPWPLERALGILEDLLARSERPREGHRHRDVKPANLLLVKEDGRERAKLIDFGIAKHFEAGDSTMQDLTQGRAIGTPYYLSPEQAEGEIVDARTDVYSAGIVAFELLTGTRPFGGSTTNAILKAILYDPPPLLRSMRADAPEALEKALAKLLAKRREERPPSARRRRGSSGRPPRRGLPATPGDAELAGSASRASSSAGATPDTWLGKTLRASTSSARSSAAAASARSTGPGTRSSSSTDGSRLINLGQEAARPLLAARSRTERGMRLPLEEVRARG